MLAGLFLLAGFLATATSLAATHDRVPDTAPLPDIVLDNILYKDWALGVCEGFTINIEPNSAKSPFQNSFKTPSDALIFVFHVISDVTAGIPRSC